MVPFFPLSTLVVRNGLKMRGLSHPGVAIPKDPTLQAVNDVEQLLRKRFLHLQSSVHPFQILSC